MKNLKFFIFFVSALFVAEATINVCIPLHPTDTAESTDDILKGIKNDIVKKLTVKDNEPNLSLDHIDVNISHPAIRLIGAVDNVKVFDLLNLNICFLENLFMNSTYYIFDVFHLTFENIRVEGKYNLTGDIGDLFDIYGDGDFWVELKNVSLSMVNFTITVADDICLPVTLELNVEEVGNWLDNFLYDEELEDIFNRAITSILPRALGIVWQEWKDIFDKPLEDEINGIFGRHNVATIFNRLKNSSNFREAPYCYDSKEM